MPRDPSAPQLPARAARLWHAALSLTLALLVGCQLVLPAVHSVRFGLDEVEGQSLSINDFAAHLHFARAVWTGSWRGDGPDAPPSPYAAAAHLNVMRDWAGKPEPVALPFGYSPTMIWLLGPFTLLPPGWAYALWTAFGVAAVCWMTRPGRPPGAAGLVLFVSPLALVCFTLGQTALLSTAALVFLAGRRDGGREYGGLEGWRRAGVDALVLWALTAKPPVAVTAGAALLATGRWRPVGLALVLTLLTTLALTPWLGPAWPEDYLRMITRYDHERADPAFAWSLRPGYMSNLRVILNLDLGVSDPVASRVSAGLWGFALAGILVAGLGLRCNPVRVWAWALLAFVLLCPHVNQTEDLHLYLLLVLAGVRLREAGWWGWLLTVGVVLVVWLSPGRSPLPGWPGPVPAFAGKVVLAGLTLACPRWATRRA
jgi:hypothetical protein